MVSLFARFFRVSDRSPFPAFLYRPSTILPMPANRMMSHARRRRLPMVLALLLTVPIMVACGSSDPASPGPGGGGGGNQNVTAVATPSGATVARGVTTSTTVVFSATGGLIIGGSLTINRQYGGIRVDQTSTQTSGTTITRVFAISADATVPAGTHEVRFVSPVTGFADGSSGTTVAVFRLTVTQ